MFLDCVLLHILTSFFLILSCTSSHFVLIVKELKLEMWIFYFRAQAVCLIRSLQVSSISKWEVLTSDSPVHTVCYKPRLLLICHLSLIMVLAIYPTMLDLIILIKLIVFFLHYREIRPNLQLWINYNLTWFS